MTIADTLSKVFLPVTLAFIMLGMGMTLIPSDFTAVIKYPKAILIGLTNQLILLPIIGFSLAIAFDLRPEMAVGLMMQKPIANGRKRDYPVMMNIGN